MTLVLRRLVTTTAIAALIAAAAVAVIQPAAPANAPAVLPIAAASDAPAEPNANAAADAEIAVELDAILAADTTATAADRGALGGKLRRLAAWDRLVHATVVVELKQGGLTTIQLDHGSITAVSPTSLAVSEAGGSSVVVSLNGETRVRRDGTKAAIGALKVGDDIFVMSKVEAGGTSAYLVVVPRR